MFVLIRIGAQAAAADIAPSTAELLSVDSLNISGIFSASSFIWAALTYFKIF
jgi:hypothetical protein